MPEERSTTGVFVSALHPHMETRETTIAYGPVSVGVDGGDQPSAVALRIDLEVDGKPVRATALMFNPDLVTGLIGQLTRMRDETWNPATAASPKAIGSVDVIELKNVPDNERWAVAVSGKPVHKSGSRDQCATIATKLRQRLQAGESVGNALVKVLQSL